MTPKEILEKFNNEVISSDYIGNQINQPIGYAILGISKPILINGMPEMYNQLNHNIDEGTKNSNDVISAVFNQTKTLDELLANPPLDAAHANQIDTVKKQIGQLINFAETTVKRIVNLVTTKFAGKENAQKIQELITKVIDKTKNYRDSEAAKKVGLIEDKNFIAVENCLNIIERSENLDVAKENLEKYFLTVETEIKKESEQPSVNRK
ncbi:MAG: hypothetical protein WCX97_03650 [Candidatus Magasanikbacteria bacterium]